jgi:hypothetical protein
MLLGASGQCFRVPADSKPKTPRLTATYPHTQNAVGLFAPGEQCSAAGALGMLYYFILAVRAAFSCCCLFGERREIH